MTDREAIDSLRAYVSNASTSGTMGDYYQSVHANNLRAWLELVERGQRDAMHAGQLAAMLAELRSTTTGEK